METAGQRGPERQLPVVPRPVEPLRFLVVVLYLIGSGAVLALIPRAWWTDPIPITRTVTATWSLVIIGLVLAIVFGAADLLGFGYPGVGGLQIVGFGVASISTLVGATELGRHRSAKL